MGLNFRGSEYYRTTWLSKRTVKDGEAMLMWSLGGKARLIVGPARVRTKFCTIRFLDRARAGPFEYLRVDRRDGVIEHLPGPTALWINPVRHVEVTVQKSLELTSPTEACVVYKTSDKLARLVVQGPTVYCPQFGERVHTFAWSTGANGTKETFERIRVAAPTILPARARVAAADGSTATVVVALSVVIGDVAKLLDGTDDLPKDLADALESDLIVLGRGLDAASLRNLRGLSRVVEGYDAASPPQAAEPALLTLDGPDDKAAVAESKQAFRGSLPRLCQRCADCGVDLRAVDFRGLEPSKELAARWSAADDDARVIQQAAQARRAADAKRRDAEVSEERRAAAADADHRSKLLQAERRADIETLDANLLRTAKEREHHLQLEAAKRFVALENNNHDLLDLRQRRNAERAHAAHKASIAVGRDRNDEIIRVLTKLKVDAGIDTTALVAASINVQATATTPTPRADGPSEAAAHKPNKATAVDVLLGGLAALGLDGAPVKEEPAAQPSPA